ncbi:putative calcium-dependent channel, 7TM region phosphate [Lupinus albus]|uniref:Putative calcium-dependent channel, 7TM region phosphate n=1 Tax=Lupinus albus TaxID=3870 RepID=A0A6A4NPI3_LUPAL|nr:putative calcium-dependent channel, 7TM region phosphate [Lupinus albus]
MNIAAILTSAGINIAICVVLFSLYSVLRKQPGNVNVYFGRRLASQHSKRLDLCLERFVPSPSWIWKAWEMSEDEILASGGLDAVVFVRILVFSIRVFSIAAVICTVLVLPVNYHGQERMHTDIPLESLDVFTIGNIKEGSKWLWAHCLALYIITLAACTLLYFEYKSITNLRLVHIIGSPPNPSHFAILVRSIPWSSEKSYCDTVKKFFSYYHSSTYLSHQMIYKSGTVQKLKDDAEHVCKVIRDASMEKTFKPSFTQCWCFGGTNSFKMICNEMDIDSVHERAGYTDKHLDARKKRCLIGRSFIDGLKFRLNCGDKECPAVFVFFKSRYAALMTAKTLQTSNPMLWVTDLAPEPQDVYWSNICIPYRQLWIRKIATLVASIVFMIVFLIPVTFVQSLTQLDNLQKLLPFMSGMLKNKFVIQVVSGYLPSVILVLFLCAVPPVMMLFSAVEGSISRSGRKKSACCKVLYFTIWNVFFVNVFAGSIISQLSVFSSVRDLPAQLAKAVPSQATFFTTYVLSSGWASLAIEVMQICPLLYNMFQRVILRVKDDSQGGSLSFPYHTEIPRILLFGFLGFTCSILAPLMLPFLLFYFFLAYLVYRNQIINVYITKYDTGGQYWPIAHNTTVFSLILAQVIALGVFGLKHSSVAFGFTIPLLICTLLFHQYCRQRFLPIFRSNSAQILIDMDLRDEHSGSMGEIYEHLSSAYSQSTLMLDASNQTKCFSNHEDKSSDQSSEDMEKGKEIIQKKMIHHGMLTAP